MLDGRDGSAQVSVVGLACAALLALVLATVPAGATAGSAVGASTNVQPLRAAALPLRSREATVREFGRLFHSVAERLERPLDFVYHDRYEDVLGDLAAGRLDLAYLGPLPYVELLRSHPGVVLPLVRFRESDGSASYSCALVTFPDNNVDLTRAAGGVLAMPQPLSTCGPLSAARLLSQIGGPPLSGMRPLYGGQHERVAQAVVAGEAAMGTLRAPVAQAYAVLGLQILAQTEPLPGFLLVVRAGSLSDVQQKALRQHLLGLAPEQQRDWGRSVRNGMELAADADYDAVRALAAQGLR